MKSLVWLLAQSIKNWFPEILRKPGKLILSIISVVFIAGLVVLSAFTRQVREGGPLDIIWLKGILYLVFILYGAIFITQALGSGSQIFDMSDVNLLFVSPVNPRLILFYGIVRMARSALVMGIFILFQGNSLGMNFGTGFGDLLLILAAFVLFMFVIQVLNLIIYSQTNGSPKRKRIAVIAVVLAAIPPAVPLAIQYARSGDFFAAAETVLRSPVFSWTPVLGWISEAAAASVRGDVFRVLLFSGVTLSALALLVLFIVKSNPDYYEDVLVATETAFEKKRALQDGQSNSLYVSARKIKVAKTGVGGAGARAVFSRHLRESFRANLFGLWGIRSFLTAAGVILWAWLARKDPGTLLIILQTLMWIQIFLLSMSRGVRELYTHYIYLIPEAPFKKIFWSNLETVITEFAECAVFFTVAGIITGAHPYLIILSITVYTFFTMMLIGIHFLFLRFAGVQINQGLFLVLFMFAVLTVIAPGVAAGIIAGSKFETWGVIVGLAVLAAWELAAALVCFASSGGLLHNCDMPVVKAAG
jgi:hypothetical protein